MDTTRVIERFERQFVRLPEAGCWVWTGPAKNTFGHGAFKVGARASKVMFSHRMAWELYVGPIPEGACVLHRCDNPACVNPHHLFLGSAKDNSDDKVSKGRQAKGEQMPVAKITAEIAAQIKRMRATPTKELARMFGLSRQAVADIVYGRTWKHVTI